MAVTTNFSFLKLIGADSAGYTTINNLIDSIDAILNTRLPGASATGGYPGHSIVANAAARPVAPVTGQMIYQADTDELLKWVIDADSVSRWMQATPEYRRNFVINGGFDVWQRNTTFNPVSATSTTGLNYGADRWQFLQATTSAAAFTRQAITSADPNGYNYYTRVQRANTLTLVTPYTIQTSFESQNIQNARNKFITLSFWARAGANYSNASSYLVSNIVTGTGTDNTVGNFTTNTVNTTTNNVLTTSWKRFVVTTSAALAQNITQLGVSFVFTPVGTAGAADYFDITGVQLEVGSAPSDFEFRDAGEELRRCQRYYYQMGPSSASLTTYGAGFMNNTTTANLLVSFPQTMRTATTTMTTSGTASNYAVATANALTTVTSTPALNVASDRSAFVQFLVTSPLTAGQGCLGVNNSSATAFLGFNSEL
jgi:hypothetical protein